GPGTPPRPSPAAPPRAPSVHLLTADPLHAQHVPHPLDLAADVVVLVQAADLQDQVDVGGAVAAGAGPGAEDVGAGVGHHVGDVRQQARPVDAVDHHMDRVISGLDALPGHVDEAVGVLGHEAGQVGAAALVDGHTAAPGDVAHDVVAGHRAAAARQPHQHVVDALDLHRLGGVAGGQRPPLDLGQPGGLVDDAGPLPVKFLKAAHHLGGRDA